MVIIFLDRSLGRLRISSWQTPHNATAGTGSFDAEAVHLTFAVTLVHHSNYTLVKSHSNSKWTLWRFLCVQVMYKLLWSFIYFYFLLKKGIWYVISMLFYLCYLFYLEATFYFGTSMTISDPPALSRWRPSWLRDAGRGHHVLALWRRQWSEKCDILLWRPFCLTSKLWKNGISSIIMYNRKIFTTHKQKTKVALCFNETLALLFGIVFFFVFFFDLPWTCKATETTTPEALKKLDGLLQSFVQNLRKVITVGEFYMCF